MKTEPTLEDEHVAKSKEAAQLMVELFRINKVTHEQRVSSLCAMLTKELFENSVTPCGVQFIFKQLHHAYEKVWTKFTKELEDKEREVEEHLPQ